MKNTRLWHVLMASLPKFIFCFVPEISIYTNYTTFQRRKDILHRNKGIKLHLYKNIFFLFHSSFMIPSQSQFECCFGCWNPNRWTSKLTSPNLLPVSSEPMDLGFGEFVARQNQGSSNCRSTTCHWLRLMDFSILEHFNILCLVIQNIEI